MELVRADLRHISDDEIRDRWLKTKPAEFTEAYVAIEGGAEIGFLAIDPIPENPHFIVYTLFVPKRLRKQGIGARLLEAAEQIAKDYGYDSVLLSPRPLDATIPRKELAAWYRKRGYDFAPEPNPAEDLVKGLCKMTKKSF